MTISSGEAPLTGFSLLHRTELLQISQRRTCNAHIDLCVLRDFILNVNDRVIRKNVVNLLFDSGVFCFVRAPAQQIREICFYLARIQGTHIEDKRFAPNAIFLSKSISPPA